MLNLTVCHYVISYANFARYIMTYFCSRLYTEWRIGTGHWREHAKHPLSSDSCATLYFTVLRMTLLSVFCLFENFVSSSDSTSYSVVKWDVTGR